MDQTTIAYEQYLQRIADIVKKVGAGKAEDTPATLDTPGKRAIYNRLKQLLAKQSRPAKVAEAPSGYDSPEDRVLELALRIDQTVKMVRPDGWRGIQTREEIIKAALFGILQTTEHVDQVFVIITAQKEY